MGKLVDDYKAQFEIWDEPGDEPAHLLIVLFTPLWFIGWLIKRLTTPKGTTNEDSGGGLDEKSN